MTSAAPPSGRGFTGDGRTMLSADARWLGRLITRRVPLHQVADALRRAADAVKVVLPLGDGLTAPSAATREEDGWSAGSRTTG